LPDSDEDREVLHDCNEHGDGNDEDSGLGRQLHGEELDEGTRKGMGILLTMKKMCSITKTQSKLLSKSPKTR